MNRYKLIIAPTPDRLELLVNAFLDKLKEEADVFYHFVGPPSVMNHEEYVQAIEVIGSC